MLNISLPKELNRPSVVALVRELFLSRREEIVRQASFSDDIEKPYGRKVLFQNPKLELLLTGWKPGYGCWPHTHGAQPEGVVCIFSGEGTFQTFSSPENEKGNGETRILSNGETVFVPRRIIHSMRNDGQRILVCIHAYWPPITEMEIYDPTMTRKWRVSGGGAWKPEPEDILEERKKE